MDAITPMASQVAALLVALLPGVAIAAERVLDVRQLEGDYKARFLNEMIGGPKGMATDELTIVRHTDQAAFISLSLYFVNGHECSLAGVAVVKGSTLLYRRPDPPNEECRLTLHIERRGITFEDDGHRCESLTCSARGHYSGPAFPLSARRPVRDVAALRRSDDFKDAVTAFEKLPPDKSKP